MHPEIKQIIQNLEYLVNVSYSSIEINYLINSFKFTTEQIIKARCTRDLPREFSNENYNNELAKFIIHLHNVMPGLWHETRQQIVLDYIQNINPKTICEIGYGTPQKYIKDYVILNNTISLLCDIDNSSNIFTNKLLRFRDIEYNKYISSKIYNMDSESLPIGYELYIFQDSLEHATNPTATLQKYVKEAPDKTNFIFCLPLEIENPVPQHNIYWKTTGEIIKWLESSGLQVKEFSEIQMNLKKDIFALQAHKDFKEITFLCKKC